MARGRMLSTNVSTSEKMADLPDDRSRLIATWTLAHLDREGRVTGSARRLRALVVPLLDHVTAAHVEKAIEAMTEVGMAVRYMDSSGQEVLSFPGFAEHQVGMRPEREAASTFGPTPELLRSNSGPTPAVRGTSEEKGSEEKGSEEKSAPSDAPKAPARPDTLSPFALYVETRWPDVRAPWLWEAVLAEAYPHADLLANAKQAAAWEASNPKSAKKDHRRFFGSWLSRGQDRGSLVRRPSPPPAPLPEVSDAERLAATEKARAFVEALAAGKALPR